MIELNVSGGTVFRSVLIVVISVALAPPIGGLAAARALRELLGVIDDIARATLGSVTIATMLKLVDRQRKSGRQTGVGSAPPA
jgi:hypothetical protein